MKGQSLKVTIAHGRKCLFIDGFLVLVTGPTYTIPPWNSPKKANERVLAVMETNNRKRRSTCNVYSPELRAKIGEVAAKCGNHAAVKKFSMELGKLVSDSRVRGIKFR